MPATDPEAILKNLDVAEDALNAVLGAFDDCVDSWGDAKIRPMMMEFIFQLTTSYRAVGEAADCARDLWLPQKDPD